MIPFSEYYIATSHNSYLRRLQILTFCCYGCAGSPAQNLIRSLELGARMVELDIHQTNIDKKVVVSHGSQVGGYSLLASERQSLEVVLEEFVSWLDRNNNFSPVILDMELGSLSEENLDYIAELLYNKLRGYILPGKMDFRTIYPENLLGRVILMAGSGVNAKLSNIVNVNKVGDWWIKNSSIPKTSDDLNDIVTWMKSNGGFVRCYPPNIILSRNFDPFPSLNAGINCVAMNYGFNDRYLKSYLKFFLESNSGMVGYRAKSQTATESKNQV